MAMNNKYEYMNEESIDPELICTICDTPLKDPQCTPCDHLFCGECIVQWIEKHNTTCPTCRHQPLTIDTLTKANRPLRNMLDRIEVKCTACGQKNLQRGEFDTHIEKVCSSANVFCSSVDIKCPWQGPRNQLEQHLTSCAFESLRPMLKQFITENQQLKEQLNQQIVENGEHQHMIQQLLEQINQQMDKNKEYQYEIELLRQELTHREFENQRYRNEIEQPRQELTHCATENQRYQNEIDQLTKRIKDQEIASHMRYQNQIRETEELVRQQENNREIFTPSFDKRQFTVASSNTDDLEVVFDRYSRFGRTETHLKEQDIRIDTKTIQKMMKDAGIVDNKYTTQLLDNDMARVLGKLTSGGIYAKGIKTFELNGFKQLVDHIAQSKKIPVDQIVSQLNSLRELSLTNFVGTANKGITDRMTDTSKYTGLHKQLFDAVEHGKGKEDRETRNTGYVGNYKGARAYDTKQ